MKLGNKLNIIIFILSCISLCLLYISIEISKPTSIIDENGEISENSTYEQEPSGIEVNLANRSDFDKLPHYSECSKADWPSNIYSPREFAQRSGENMGRVLIAKAFLEMLDDVAVCYSEKTNSLDLLAITSCFRDPPYNNAVGGIEDSKHVGGFACDIRKGVYKQNSALESCVEEANSKAYRLEIIRYENYYHLEMEKSHRVSTRVYNGEDGVYITQYKSSNGDIFTDENACKVKK